MSKKHEIKLRLSDDEFENLNKKVMKSHLSREGFIRACISKVKFKEQPPVEYYKLINEFNAIGNNLNQLTRQGYLNNQNEELLNNCLKELHQAIAAFVEVVR